MTVDIFKMSGWICIKKFNFVDSHWEDTMTDKNGFKGKSGGGNICQLKAYTKCSLGAIVEFLKLQNL